MAEEISSNKRLAKNTVLLYGRTLLMTLIGFYTTRVIINALGIENYGINNVVGGFIAMFAVVQHTLNAACTRFMTFEIGKGEKGNPLAQFGAVMAIHIVLALFMVVLLESFGFYFLNNGLNIPEERMWAARWVFHFSVLSMGVGILNTPYIGLIIAHERMNAFAYMSIFDVSLKLGIVFLLYVTPYDKLISYSLFYLLTGFVSVAIYNYYSRKHFSEAKFTIVREKQRYKDIFSFAGINFLGGVASMLSTHGTNILINIFYGVTLNAAMGVANQVKGISTKFVGDFMMALKPQITKEYAAGNVVQSMKLSFRGSKISYFLTLILAVPLIARTPYILEFWIKIFPPEAVLFSRLAIIYTMLVLLSNSLVTEALASGNIKELNILVGGTRLMIVPFAWLALKFTGLSYMVLVVQIVMEIVSLFFRLLTLNHITGINHIFLFSKQVLVPISAVTLISSTIAYVSNVFVPDTFIGLCIVTGVSMTTVAVTTLYIGLTDSERETIFSFASNKLSKFLHHSK